MEWSPWENQEQNKPPTAQNQGQTITKPPCEHCKHFKPEIKFAPGPQGQRPNGVTICHANEMHHDFSCYTPKPGQPDTTNRVPETQKCGPIWTLGADDLDFILNPKDQIIMVHKGTIHIVKGNYLEAYDALKMEEFVPWVSFTNIEDLEWAQRLAKTQMQRMTTSKPES